MKILSSSLRERNLDSTLKYALLKAADLNITRVTDTTLLDKIGIPIYASIRPQGNSLCVNSGKGFTANEAKIGALMEAIEYAYTEYSYSKQNLKIFTIAELIAQLPNSFKIEDFALKFGKRAATNELIACIQCQHLIDLQHYLIPAELVFIPFHENPGVSLFGTSTNGLASGNSVLEASLHAICELLERDTTSFNQVKDTTVWVDVEHSTTRIIQMIKQIEEAGLNFALRYANNVFGLPYFKAYIIDEFTNEHVSVSAGFGLHPVKEIAAVRAIAEAVQSRLSTIHGGRDDIIGDFNSYKKINEDEKLEIYLKKKNEVLNRQPNINFASIIEPILPETIDQALQSIIAVLKHNGIKDIFRYVFTEPADNLHVVKIIIPKLEFFEHKSKRMGPRLLNFILNESN